ncbi:hypothetical protein OAL43_01015 [bacterium]|nr:hypothetical protein [Rubripirellula sp.]MDC0278763.1 hypothetical protein [bacterium]MDC0295413.1 hypothetical protein [bacterium]
MLFCLPLLVGCEGCRTGEQQAKKDEAVPIDAFVSRPMRSFPSDETQEFVVKPNHWTTAQQSLKSQQFDARGELTAIARSQISGVASRPLVSSDQVTRRPIVLPQGQWRRFDFRTLPAVTGDSNGQSSVLENVVSISGKQVDLPNLRKVTKWRRILEPQEYFFVILTNRPERFARLQAANWVRHTTEDFQTVQSQGNYRIILPSASNGIIALPQTMLDWTGTAVLLWDNFSADSLTLAQQNAIADWVRFGGQIIINGTVASESIGYSALADLLPMHSKGNVELDTKRAADLLKAWNVSGDQSLEKQVAVLNAQSRLSFSGPLASNAESISQTGQLINTLAVGRGRVVQTRFDLTSDWITGWDSYDSFMNGVVLNRPRRQFREINVVPLDEKTIEQFYPDFGNPLSDAGFNTNLRISSRDALLFVADDGERYSTRTPSRYDSTTAVDSVGGIASWLDNSDVVLLSREILKKESGIEVPKASLVTWMLGIYLLILIPGNYMVFRIMGRLELAWIAIPLIAAIGAIVVARLSRLDIGFARSQTELSLLEVHSGYSRGHLTRFVSVYNSLSDQYEINFDTPDAVARPMLEVDQDNTAEPPVFELGRNEGPTLAEYPIRSNQSRMFRAEQVVDLGGSFQFSKEDEISNQSNIDLNDVFILHRETSGNIRVAFLGELGGGVTSKVRFQENTDYRISDELPMQTSRLMQMLASKDALPPGSIRLIGRHDALMDGMILNPEPQQKTGQTVVLAHLIYPKWPAPKSDLNLPSSLRKVLGKEDTENDNQPEALIEQ